MHIAHIGSTSTRTSSSTGWRRSWKPSGGSCPQNRFVRKLSTRLIPMRWTQWVLPWPGWSLPRMLDPLSLKENESVFRLVAFCVSCSPSTSPAKINYLTNWGLRMPIPRSPVSSIEHGCLAGFPAPANPQRPSDGKVLFPAVLKDERPSDVILKYMDGLSKRSVKMLDPCLWFVKWVMWCFQTNKTVIHKSFINFWDHVRL